MTMIALLTMTLNIVAQRQKLKNELQKNICLSASNFLAYRGPLQPRLTAAPKGTAPFYISHYGRHGSRYMTQVREYDYVLDILRNAHQLHKLSSLGEDVYQRVQLIKDESYGRYGELTALGQQQHRDIARRMMERFPEVFSEDACIHARSTLVVRCILSMESELLQLVSMNPKLRINSDARFNDLHYLQYMDMRLSSQIRSEKGRKAFDDYCRMHQCWKRVIGQLFNDTAYVNTQVNGERMNYYLFRMAGSVQNMELRRKLTLYDLFTDDEVVENWRMNNVYWFLGYGFTPLTGGKQPYTQRHLLRRIIEEADSCIQHPHPGATLRFGHDTSLLPLVCLMGVNGYDQSIEDLEKVDKKGWLDYEVFPMASNLQLVFYRKSADDPDVLLKVLLNEDEATLPLPDDLAPYYRWSDFRDYYLKKLDSYIEQ